MYEKSNEALNLFFLRLFEELSTLEDEVEQLKKDQQNNQNSLNNCISKE